MSPLSISFRRRVLSVAAAAARPVTSGPVYMTTRVNGSNCHAAARRHGQRSEDDNDKGKAPTCARSPRLLGTRGTCGISHGGTPAFKFGVDLLPPNQTWARRAQIRN